MMAITRKPPQKPSETISEMDEAKVRQLIHKGGTPPAQGVAAEVAEGETKRVQLRLSKEVLDAIDAALAKRNALVRPSRHGWLLEAIAEKMEKEG